MAGAMRRVGEYLGLVEHSDFEDEEFAGYGPDETAVEESPRVARLDEHRESRPPVRNVRPSSGLNKIETVVPTSFDDARRIGENFRSNVPVIMNLSEIGEDEAKRLVDFASGLVFAVHGHLTRITAKVFLLTPEHIEASEDDQRRLAAGGFFAQE